MGIVTITDEFTSPISAPRMFKAFILDGDNLLPKIAPQVFKNIETIQGDGGPGTIKQMNFAEGSAIKFVKHRVDAIDKEKMTYAYTLIEGDTLMDKIDSISYEINFESMPDGGCKGKNTSKYNTKPGVEIKEEEIKAGKEMAAGIVKAVEAYLLANPNEYV
ncbi:PREDICTED: major allergen Pru ar 1-like [Nicotiana attenuata]|uniref:major allergen Pru ar 1-like n=1 Tax=Nicotiana attenuata TaxID=49451 RepID=UPI000904FED3|nr:PREDICTED: major allergen Pru ar 1-like [Nicotiana attenuata]